MSASTRESVLPRATGVPTDERDGRDIPVHVVACPFCGREGTASITIQLCHGCGHWFEVEVEEAGEE